MNMMRMIRMLDTFSSSGGRGCNVTNGYQGPIAIGRRARPLDAPPSPVIREACGLGIPVTMVPVLGRDCGDVMYNIHPFIAAR